MAHHEDPYAVRIEDLCLTVRCYNALKRDGIDTVGQLVRLPERYLLALRNFTPRTMAELKDKLLLLDLSPWDTWQPVKNRPAGRPPGRLARWVLNAAGVLLPAMDRDRWLEEWHGELHVLRSRGARARFLVSLLVPLLLAGGRKFAVTLRHAWPSRRRF
jgi:hypothetical protein